MLTQRAHRGRDAGMTLIELIVGMTLMTIVGTIALNFFVGTTAQANRVGEQSLVAGSARVAMNQIVQTLQVADSSTAAGSSSNRFVTISATEVAFYSNLTNASRSGSAQRVTPSLVDFKIANGVLNESITPPGANAPTSTNTLATGLTNAVVFTYCSDATDPSTSCTPTTNVGAVAMVQITITVQGLKNTTPQTVQTGVAINGAMS